MAEQLTSLSVMNRLVVQPSKMLTGVPPFVFTAPDGWVLDEAPGSLAVIRLPEEVDGFWVNALISHDKVARSVDFETAAKVTWAKQQKSVDDLTDRGERLMRFGNVVMYIRGAEFSAPKGGRRLAQLQALWFAPVTEGGKVVDFFQLVLTAPVEHMSKFSPAIIEMLSTFRFV
jgi:hypothetical protein